MGSRWNNVQWDEVSNIVTAVWAVIHSECCRSESAAVWTVEIVASTAVCNVVTRQDSFTHVS